MTNGSLIALYVVVGLLAGCEGLTPPSPSSNDVKHKVDTTPPSKTDPKSSPQEEKPELDLRIVAITGPTRIHRGSAPTFSITIENRSDKDIEGVSIDLRAVVRRPTSVSDLPVGWGVAKGLRARSQKAVKVKARSAYSRANPAGTIAWTRAATVNVYAYLHHYGQYSDTNKANDSAAMTLYVR